MIHLTDKGKELCRKLRKEGFNGVRFEEVTFQGAWTLDDFDGDAEALEKYKRDHASFIAQPRMEIYDDWEDNEYTSPPSFNKSKFTEELIEFVKKEMGEGVTVEHYPGCDEFECIRDKLSGPKIDFVTSDDWEGLYIDGELKCEGHSVQVYEVIKALGYRYEQHTADEEWLEERGYLPQNITEVVTEQ